MKSLLSLIPLLLVLALSSSTFAALGDGQPVGNPVKQPPPEGSPSSDSHKGSFLIGVLGDSYGSGEGNPDVDQTFDGSPCSIGPLTPPLPGCMPGLGFVKAGPQWHFDKPCHRSAKSGFYLASQELQSVLHAPVDFISLACTGAVTLAMYDVNLVPSYSPDDGQTLKQTQILELATLANGRKIDALFIVGGGDDIGFTSILTGCVKNEVLYILTPRCDQIHGYTNEFTAALTGLKQRLTYMANAIKTHLNVDHIYLLEYPDFSHGDNGAFCGEAGNSQMLGAKDGKTAEWMHNSLLNPLNDALRTFATDPQNQKNGWIYVGGVAEAFKRHGFCAHDTWYVQWDESYKKQGPIPALAPGGVMHPNAGGQAAISQALVQAVKNNASQFVVPVVKTIPSTLDGCGAQPFRVEAVNPRTGQTLEGEVIIQGSNTTLLNLNETKTVQAASPTGLAVKIHGYPSVTITPTFPGIVLIEPPSTQVQGHGIALPVNVANTPPIYTAPTFKQVGDGKYDVIVYAASDQSFQHPVVLDIYDSTGKPRGKSNTVIHVTQGELFQKEISLIKSFIIPVIDLGGEIHSPPPPHPHPPVPAPPVIHDSKLPGVAFANWRFVLASDPNPMCTQLKSSALGEAQLQGIKSWNGPIL